MQSLGALLSLMLFDSSTVMRESDSNASKNSSSSGKGPFNQDLVFPDDAYAAVLWILFWAAIHSVMLRGVIVVGASLTLSIDTILFIDREPFFRRLCVVFTASVIPLNWIAIPSPKICENFKRSDLLITNTPCDVGIKRSVSQKVQLSTVEFKSIGCRLSNQR
ncbi:hypothetical protein BJ741DRAFT_223804 [Chytriomyces cf. hyalinus JEL632]|nr:hypothetical protein BJ741DRAFT_223804 [Chytriomyces cf. hyalinus JEL632]